MVERKRLLKIRKALNKKRPHFVRQESWLRLRLAGKSYRRPKGRDSKMRERRVSKHKIVDAGYRGPAAVRGLHPSGLRQIRILKLSDLEKINPKEEIGIVSRTLGLKKKYLILKKAQELGIKITNIRDPKKILAKVEAKQKKKKEEKKEETKPLSKPPEKKVEKPKPKKEVESKK